MACHLLRLYKCYNIASTGVAVSLLSDAVEQESDLDMWVCIFAGLVNTETGEVTHAAEPGAMLQECFSYAMPATFCDAPAAAGEAPAAAVGDASTFSNSKSLPPLAHTCASYANAADSASAPPQRDLARQLSKQSASDGFVPACAGAPGSDEGVFGCGPVLKESGDFSDVLCDTAFPDLASYDDASDSAFDALQMLTGACAARLSVRGRCHIRQSNCA